MDTSAVEIKAVGFRGGMFSGFYAQRDRTAGPGWYVFGSNPAYGGRYVMLCARPRVPARKVRLYNAPVRRGWRTKAAAQAVADTLNRRDADCRGCYLDLPLHGTRFPENDRS